MKLYNLKDHNEQVSFAQAVTQGLGKNQGLFFPHDLPEFSLTEIDEMLKLDFVTRSAKILSAFIGDEIPQEILEERVRAAFAFPAPVANVESDVGCLELFHGPTLAFKALSTRQNQSTARKTVLYIGRQYRNCCHRRRFRCLSGAGEAGV